MESGTLSDLRHLTRTSVAVQSARPPDVLATLDGLHGLRVDGTRARFDGDTARLDEVMRPGLFLAGRSIGLTGRDAESIVGHSGARPTASSVRRAAAS